MQLLNELLLLFATCGFIDAHVGPCASDYYEELKIDRDATERNVYRAYRRFSLATHPDKLGNDIKFVCIRAAYDTLGDPAKRELYDTSLWFMSLASSIEDTSKGACADREDKEVCRSELEEILKQLFRNASFDGSANNLSKHFDFDGMRDKFAFFESSGNNLSTHFDVEGAQDKFGFNAELEDMMEQAWVNFTAENPNTAFVLSPIRHLHIVKMLAFSGSKFHALRVDHMDEASKAAYSAALTMTNVVKHLKRTNRKMMAAGRAALNYGRGLMTSGRIFFERILDQVVTGDLLIDGLSSNITYDNVDDVFASAKYAVSRDSDGSLFKVKCCCHIRGKCKIVRLTSTPRMWYQRNANSCEHLVARKWHSYRKYNNRCVVPKTEAELLREQVAKASPDL